MAATRPNRKTQVLSAGLPRTGSYSMSLALQILGYKDVYHCIDNFDNSADWRIMGEAADALFPVLPTYNGKGMTVDDWDKLFGPCEAITDPMAPFGESLLACYPDAKVILVLRDFDKWEPSMRQLLDGNFGKVSSFVRDYVEPLIGTTFTMSVQKCFLGWAGSRDSDEMKSRLREIYDRRHKLIRETVPPAQLLEYRLGSGWEPLCHFLGKKVPNEPFPHGNEAAALRKVMLDKKLRSLAAAGRKVMPHVTALVILTGSAWYGWLKL